MVPARSTVLRVVQFLGDAARFQLGAAVRAFGGMNRVRTRRAGKAAVLSIHIKAIVTKHAHRGALDEYDLRLRTLPPDRFAHYETFQFKRTATQGRRITLEGGRLHVEDQGRQGQRRALDKDAIASTIASRGLLNSFDKGARKTLTGNGTLQHTPSASFEAFRTRVAGIPRHR
jgi:hypothetical protein